MKAKPVLGVALGGGAARGWSHIGVLQALEDEGLVPDVISGASIGALVGAAFAAGRLDALERWVVGLTRLDVLKLLDARFTGGVIDGGRVMRLIEELLQDRDIRALARPFAAVATDLNTGRAVWLREGSTIAAVRASCAMPGLFPPRRHQHAWLVDGGLVDPVPVTLARTLGADLVIAVDLSSYRRSIARLAATRTAPETAAESIEAQGYLARLQVFMHGLFDAGQSSANVEPGLMDAISGAIHIMQERITRSRLAGDPPDVLITPALQDVALMDFHKAEYAVRLGREAVQERHAELALLRAALGV